MTIEIYTFEDSNMARQEWNWTFSLERLPDYTLCLTAVQEFIEPDEDDEPLEIEQRTGIRDGADLYEAFCGMLEETGIEVDMVHLPPIAKRISKFDPQIAKDFWNGAKILELRADAETKNEADRRAMLIAPFLPQINEYCLLLNDDRTRGGGGISRASLRTRVRAFLEHYALKHGALPHGRHKWALAHGFLAGDHDFGDLGTT